MSTVKFRPGIEFKRYVAGKMELERADKRFVPDKPKAMGDMVAREKSMMDFLEANVCITPVSYTHLQVLPLAYTNMMAGRKPICIASVLPFAICLHLSSSSIPVSYTHLAERRGAYPDDVQQRFPLRLYPRSGENAD